MRRIILTFVFIMSSAVALLAAEPKLECYKFFEDAYLKNPKAEVTLINEEDDDSSFYKYVVSGDEKTANEILRAVELDTKKTKNKIVNYKGGRLVKSILTFEDSSGKETTVIYRPEGGTVTLSISTE